MNEPRTHWRRRVRLAVQRIFLAILGFFMVAALWLASLVFSAPKAHAAIAWNCSTGITYSPGAGWVRCSNPTATGYYFAYGLCRDPWLGGHWSVYGPQRRANSGDRSSVVCPWLFKMVSVRPITSVR